MSHASLKNPITSKSARCAILILPLLQLAARARGESMATSSAIPEVTSFPLHTRPASPAPLPPCTPSPSGMGPQSRWTTSRTSYQEARQKFRLVGMGQLSRRGRGSDYAAVSGVVECSGCRVMERSRWRGGLELSMIYWRPRRDLNPCYRRERAPSLSNINALLRTRTHR